MSLERRRQMIEPDRLQLSVVRQCELVSISRSGFYHRPKGELHDVCGTTHLKIQARVMTDELGRDETGPQSVSLSRKAGK
jgi:hypothetical protein